MPETGEVLAKGIVERIGEDRGGEPVADHGAAIAAMIATPARPTPASTSDELGHASAVGHRVVHGGPDFSDPVVIDDDGGRRDPRPDPAGAAAQPGRRRRHRGRPGRAPDVPQVAVFDTAFFATLPAAARRTRSRADLAEQHRIRRYGFHGTSHQYVSRRGGRAARPRLGELNQIVLHLGNGCSASAVRGGVAVETSMGLTPLRAW